MPGPTKNAIRCKRWRNSHDAEARKEKDRKRKRLEREKLKNNQKEYEYALLKDRLRKRSAKGVSTSSSTTCAVNQPASSTSNKTPPSASIAHHAPPCAPTPHPPSPSASTTHPPPPSASAIDSVPTLSPSNASTSSTILDPSTSEPLQTGHPSTPPPKSTPPPTCRSTPFRTKQSLYRSLKKTRSNLPKDSQQCAYVLSNIISSDLSPNKQNFVLQSLRRKCSPSPKGRKKVLSTDKEEFLLEYLQTPGISYTLPGRRDTVYVGIVDGQRQYKPKHYLLWNVQEITGMLNRSQDVNAITMSFKDKFGSEISFSTVYRFIKSQKQVLYQAEIPCASCLCAKCENFELLLEGIRKALPDTDIPHSTEDILKLFTCDQSSRTCAYSDCTNCPSPSLQNLEQVEEVNFYSWETNDGKKYPEKLPKTITGEEAQSLLLDQVAKIKVHMYLKQKQYISYQATKANLKENELLIHVDFSENYDNKQKNAIQSAYFGYQSFSLYTVCVYKHEKGDVTCDSYTLVTSSTDHIAKTVFALNRFLLLHLKAKHQFDTVHFFSDGAACQFRSKNVFAFLAQYDRTITVNWHFFETSHGKGPVDGVGGTVKSVVHRKVMGGHVVIGSAREFAEYANLVVKNIEVLYVPEEQMDVGNIQIDDPPKVPGTLQVRYIERQLTDDQASLLFYQLSPQCGDVIPPFREVSYPVKSSEQSQPTSTCSQEQCCPNSPADTSCIPGQWYAAYYHTWNYWFVGHAIDVEGKFVKLDFLEQKNIGVNAFIHKQEDIKTLPTSTIFYKLEKGPEPVSTFRYDSLCLSEEDFSEIQTTFKEKYLS